MINNRQGGRRRGRGGQRPQGMSGGSGNRQDNRQRGNATQLLEKYKSMARDAQLAGDRVQTEYYLQFADHYYRVLGEGRVRFDEQKRGRDEEADGDEDGDSELAEVDSEVGADADAGEQPSRRRGRSRDRDERPERSQGRSNSDDRNAQEESGADERIAFEALPPPIGGDAEEGEAADEAPRPRRRARRPRGENGETDAAPAA